MSLLQGWSDMFYVALRKSKFGIESVTKDELPFNICENMNFLESEKIEFLHDYCEVYDIHYYVAFSKNRYLMNQLMSALRARYDIKKREKKMLKKIDGNGYFRKSKAYGLVCGIALGIAFFGSSVSAEEISSEATENTNVAVTTTVVDATEASSVDLPIETTESTTTVADDVTETTTVPISVGVVAESAPQTEAVAPVEVASKSTATVDAPVEVASKSTATVDVTSERNDGYNSVTTIKTELTAPAKAGDIVTYTTKNLSLAGLNGLAVTTDDGTVIGKVIASNTYSPADLQAAGKTGLSPGANSSKVIVTFNENVEKLDSVLYTLKLVGQSQTVLSSTGYDMTASILTAGNEIVSESVHVAATQKENLNDTYAYLSRTASVQKVSQDGTVNGSLVFGVYTSSEEPMKIGDTMTLKLDDKSPLLFDTTAANTAVGSRQTVKPSRVFDGTNVDSNNIITVDKSTAVFEVVSATEDTVVVKLVEGNLAKDGRYGYLVFKDQVVDPTAFDMDGKLVKGVSYTSTVTTGAGPQVVNQTLDLPIIGALAQGSAIRVYGNVVEVNQLEDGTILSKADVTPGNVVVGTAYDTTDQVAQIKAKDGKLYDLVSTGANSKGLVERGTTTVVNIYKLYTETKRVKTGEVFGTVKLIKVDETGKVLKEAETVTDELKVLVAEEYTTYVTSGDVVLSETKEVVSTVAKYDATNMKEEVIEVDGKPYKIVVDKSEIGKLIGDVVEGETLITLVYKEEVKPVETPKAEEPKAPIPTTTPVDPTTTPVEQKVVSQAVLPKTGEATSILSFIGAGVLSSIGLFGFKKKKED